MATLTCDIVHLQDRCYLTDEATMVVIPGQSGEMGVMAGHVPILSKLKDGAVRCYLDGGAMKTFVTQGGYAYCTGEQIYILADRAVDLDDVDVAEVTAKRKEYEDRLSEAEEGSIKQKVTARKIRWCDIRLKIKQEQSGAAAVSA